jgi:hypothetical protein
MAVDFKQLVKRLKEDKSNVRDRDWIRHSFMVGGKDVDETWTSLRFYSSGDRKFSDTSLGGSLACNNKTQYTRYSDVRNGSNSRMGATEPSIYADDYNVGMGLYYSEAIEDNTMNLIMSFGVPKFNSLMGFFSSAIDEPTSQVASHVAGTAWYQKGKLVGHVISTYLALTFKFYAIGGALIYGIQAAKKIVFGTSQYQYYYFKPGMHVYWTSVNMLVTQTAIEMGLATPELQSTKGDNVGASAKMKGSDVKELNEVFGDLMEPNGLIDVRKLVGRAQRLMNVELENSRAMNELGSASQGDWEKFIYSELKDTTDETSKAFDTFLSTVFSGKELYQRKKIDIKEGEEPGNIIENEIKRFVDADGGLVALAIDKVKAAQKDLEQYYKAASIGGSQYAIFNVEYIGEQTRSFDSTYKDIPTQEGINTMGGAARAVQFSTAGGNIIGAGIDSLIGAGVQLLEGAASSVTLGASNVLTALIGGGFIEMPKMWDNSTISAQEYTFKMRLSQPYNHPLSKLHKQMIPMMMILGGALPLEAGAASYVSPFLCQAFMKGQLNIDLGMITQVTITTNVGNVGTASTGNTLGIVLEFTITDFSTMLRAPISSLHHNSIISSFNEENAMGRFLTSLAGRDLFTSRYASRGASMRWMRTKVKLQAMVSPEYIGMMAANYTYPLTSVFIGDGVGNVLKESEKTK